MNGFLRLAICVGGLCPVTFAAAQGEGPPLVGPTAQMAYEPVTISLESPEHGVAFHLLLDATSTSDAFLLQGNVIAAQREAITYEAICQAPCEVRLPPGRHVLALSLPGGVPVRAEPVLELQSPQRITGTYIDRAGQRAAGATLLVLGSLIGAALIPWGVSLMSQTSPPSDSTSADAGLALAIGGSVAALLGYVLGLVLGLQEDGARIEY